MISTVNHRFLLLCGESVQICVSIDLRIAAPGSRFKLVTTPTETCPICGGTGWQTIERGKEREAVRCECRVRDRGGRLLAAAHIPARYQHCELSNFQCDPPGPPQGRTIMAMPEKALVHGQPDDTYQKSIRDARFFAGRFVEEYPTDKTGLLFVGSVGVGKTHLAVGIIKDLIREKGIHCLFCDYRELLKSIQNSYNPSVQATEMEILRPVFDAEVLVLDELGAVRSTEWVFDTVNYVLNSRYNDNKTTIITTNFPDKPEQDKAEVDNLSSRSAADRAARRETLGDRIGERMRSRLHEMCKKVEIEGLDFREHSKQAQFRRHDAPSRVTLRSTKRNG
jgi:DNA replication protein DnaC